MAPERPHVVMIAGPNGAGKSTVAPGLLAGALGVVEFVNADLIARGLSGFDPDRAAFEAGRIMLDRIEYLSTQRVNFAFETTLASRSFAPRVAQWRRVGYVFHLVYVWLPHPDIAIARVADRVRLKGHHVPEEIVRRRFLSGLGNFFRLYRPLADRWRFYYNPDRTGPRLIATGCGTVEELILEKETWKQVLKGPSDERTPEGPD
jgi:predicted ABC-type ATPase